MVKSFFGVTAYLVGCGIALSFSWVHLAPVIDRYRMIPAWVSAELQSLAFACKSVECVSCLQGVLQTPRAIVFTSGSTFRYALNFETFSQAMPRPVVNCIRNDSLIDAYAAFFDYAPFNQAGQVVFHGYNSWAVNSPGTWASEPLRRFFALPSTAPPPTLARWAGPDAERLAARTALTLLYAHIFFTRALRESPYEWRMFLRARYPYYDRHELKFWPLSRERHQERRLALMKRYFGLSAYVRSFIIDADRLLPAPEIAARHERFLQVLAPTRRVVFFAGPELSDAFPERVKEVMRQSKRVMVETLAKNPEVLHVDIDYRACGVASSDFWQDAAMYFDLAHPNSQATAKITTCVTDALAQAGLEKFVGP